MKGAYPVKHLNWVEIPQACAQSAKVCFAVQFLQEPVFPLLEGYIVRWFTTAEQRNETTMSFWTADQVGNPLGVNSRFISSFLQYTFCGDLYAHRWKSYIDRCISNTQERENPRMLKVSDR